MLSTKWRWVFALAALTAAAPPAMAQSARPLYIVGGIGYADHSIGVAEFNAAYALAIPPTADAATTSKSATALKIGLGYQVNPNIAFEGSYGSLGRASYAVVRPGAAPIGGTFENKIEPIAAQVSVLGIFPLNPNIDAFGRLGVAYVDNTGKISQSGGFPAGGPCGGGIVCQQGVPTSDWAGVLGMGVNFTLQSQWFLRAEFEYYTKYKVASVPDMRAALGPGAQAGGDLKIDTMVWSLGLGYRF